MSNAVIIVAGGSGSRMNSSIPKQFLSLAGRPIIAHTIDQFLKFDSGIEIIVVLPRDHFSTFQEIKEEYFQKQEIKIATGGDTRFHSVKNGLQSLSDSVEIVGIHDAVRPLIPKEIISKAYLSAKIKGSGVVAVPLKDTLRRISGNGPTSLNRADFVSVQTPQCFKKEIIEDAAQQNYQVEFTDDANVVEMNGHEIHISEGSYDNIKITTPEDLMFANALLQSQVDS